MIRLPDKVKHPVIEGDFLTKYYHAPIVRYFFRYRLEIAFSFINGKRFNKILDIGFGSGVFLAQLSQVCDYLYGVDVHKDIDKVELMLKNENVQVCLKEGDVLNLPYQNESFDCIISMSTLEHVVDTDKAISEIHRVLKHNGRLVLGFPVVNKITNFLLGNVMGAENNHKKKLHDIHPSDHRRIISSVIKVFGFKPIIKKIPNIFPLDLSFYCCLSLEKGLKK